MLGLCGGKCVWKKISLCNEVLDCEVYVLYVVCSVKVYLMIEVYW